jgi:hypothetical protein
MERMTPTMRGIFKFVGFGALALWTLLCFLFYQIGDGLEDWLAANANLLLGDEILGSLTGALLNAGQGLGFVLALMIWAVGTMVILGGLWLVLKILPRRRAIARAPEPAFPAQPGRYEPSQPVHASRHAKQANRLSKALDAAKNYR